MTASTHLPPIESSVTSLPSGIEILRPGLFRSDSGDEYHITTEMIHEIANSYTPSFHEAPLVAGHVAHDKPAYGWVEQAYVNDAGRLAMNTDKVEPQFAEMVRCGRFKKRSVSLYHPHHPANPTPGKWQLKHVAFLGAQPPAVKGLKDIEFSENGECVSFSESLPSISPSIKKEINMPDPTSTTATAESGNDAAIRALQEQIAELQKQNQNLVGERDAALAELKAAQAAIAAHNAEKEKQQAAEIAQFAESMVKAGRILPHEKAMEIAIMTDLQKAEPVQFSEGNTTRTESKLEAYKKRIAGREAAVQFGEFAPASTTAESPAELSDEELNRRVEAYRLAHPDVSYVDAMAIVKAGQDQ